MDNNPTNEAITEETRQMFLTAQTRAAIALINEISSFKPKVDDHLIQELRNFRTDLVLSGDEYNGFLIQLAIEQLGGTV